MSSTTNIPHEPIEIDVNSLETSATRLVCIVRPTWITKTLTVKNLVSDKNNNYYSISPNVDDDDEQHDIILKLYPDNSDVYIDHSFILESINQFSQYGLASHVVLTFKNGYLANFIPGKQLITNDLHTEELIAQKLAEFHSISMQSNPNQSFVNQLRIFVDLLTKKNPILHDRLIELKDKSSNVNASFISVVASTLGFNTTPTLLTIDQLESHLKDTSWAELSTEIDFIRIVFEDHWSKYHIPEVLCLNNLNTHNFLYDSKNQITSIIDFDHCSRTYFLVDIVSYFLELANENPENKYPTRNVQKSFLKEYLKHSSINLIDIVYNPLKPTDIELERLCDWCGLLIAPVHLYWALWAFLQALLVKPTTTFNFIIYGKNRLAQYQKHKQNFFLPLYNQQDNNNNK